MRVSLSNRILNFLKKTEETAAGRRKEAQSEGVKVRATSAESSMAETMVMENWR